MRTHKERLALIKQFVAVLVRQPVGIWHEVRASSAETADDWEAPCYEAMVGKVEVRITGHNPPKLSLRGHPAKVDSNSRKILSTYRWKITQDLIHRDLDPVLDDVLELLSTDVELEDNK